METKERLREIAAKERLTAKDKKFVEDLCAEHGVTIDKKGCANCYRDAAVVLWKRLAEADFKAENVHYKLKEGTNLIHNGERVNAATATDENISRWLATGLPVQYVMTI